VARQAPATRLPVRKEISAGGVVVRQDGPSYLVALLKTEHKRGEVWVLPKGHVELHTGERVSDAARREVQEEAGLSDLSVKNQLGVTRFKFQAEDAVVYKTVHYFLMTTQQKQLIPQAEEGLLEAAWFEIDEAIKRLEYDTDQEIVRRARERMLGIPAPRRPRRTGRPVGRRRTSRIHT
jgi:ADP-ribose pyrophosphatase YjhB (NUDIX family)